MGETVRKFRKVFNFQDPDAKGRCCVLIFKVVEGFLTYITTGIFYTEFLRCYGMDSVAAGVLSFIPYIASMLVLFTPALLNRFPRRKWILAVCKFMYYFVVLVGVNLLPYMVTDDRGRLMENRSVSLEIQVSRQMLAIFTTLGFKEDALAAAARGDDDDEL